MSSRFRAVLSYSFATLLLLSGCASSNTIEYDQGDRSLPKQPAEWGYSTAPEETGLNCRTNIISGVRHDYNVNTIVSTEEFDVALVGAELTSGDARDRFSFYLAPDKTHGPDGNDPDVRMLVEAQNGLLFTYKREEGEITTTLARGEQEEDITNLFKFTVGGSRGLLTIPLPSGIITEDQPLKYVELTLNDQLLGRCEPVEGRKIYPQAEKDTSSSPATNPSRSTGDPKLDEYTEAMSKAGISIQPGNGGTYSADTKLCEKMQTGDRTAWDLASNERLATPEDENARRVQAMVPILCPDQQSVVDEALSGTAVQTEITDGKFIVRQHPEAGVRVVQPGLWQTKKSIVSDSYYERNDGSGNIIENSFINHGEKIQIEILPTDGAFVSESCGGWERVN